MPHPNQAAIVRHPDLSGALVVLDPATDYASSDILVKLYPAFFTEIANGDRIVESVRIEAATAAPGEKRARGRAKK